jgi:hypothetical protein
MGLSGQKIVLFIVVALTLSVHWALHRQPLGSPAASLIWTQPSSLGSLFANHISPNEWPFDFESAEQILLALKQNSEGELILNHYSVSVLEAAVRSLPDNLSGVDLKRVELLIIKGLPGRAGSELASLLSNYYGYRAALENAKTLSNSDSQELKFEQSVLLQEQFFGEDLTQRLFGKRNRLNGYLFARKRINEDPLLDAMQKKKELSILKRQFTSDDN